MKEKKKEKKKKGRSNCREPRHAWEWLLARSWSSGLRSNFDSSREAISRSKLGCP